jgi:hypothetical protein
MFAHAAQLSRLFGKAKLGLCMHEHFRIRTLGPHEIALALDWAAAEGWNPGLADATCFATVDLAGFLVGELDGAPAATVSVVNYDDRAWRTPARAA